MFEPHVQTNGEVAFFIFAFPDKVWPFLYFSDRPIGHIPRTNGKKSSLVFVGLCMINTV